MMRSTITGLLAAVVLLVASAITMPAAGQTTWYVDADNCPGPGSGLPWDPYCAIQTAIGYASDGDEIEVAPGIYYESIDLLGKAITLRSDTGPRLTTIDAGGEPFYRTVVTCNSGEGPDTVLDGFTITGAYEYDYGGGMYNEGSSPAVTDCIFTENLAVEGGGMYNSSSHPTVTNCTFVGNYGAHGGGMFNDNGSKPTVVNCTFFRNTAHRGGGMFNWNNSDPTVIGCMFSGNFSVLHGGGMWNMGSSPTVINCTFNGNAGEIIGGGMMINAGNPVLINCILWGNAPEEIWDWSDSLVVTYSNVQGGWPGQGNSSGDPLFVRRSDSDCCLPNHYGTGCADPACEAIVCEAYPECCAEEWHNYCAALAIELCGDLCSRDLHLQPGSPCIDAGDNTAVPEGITTDLDGHRRFVDDPDTEDTGVGGNGYAEVVDRGAYEFQFCPCDCEETPDGTVDAGDFLALLAQWGGPGSCDCEDVPDDSVDAGDFLALLAAWGPCP